ncbi:MaoC family dehydratase [Paraburkholderia sp. J67]|uniref:MaoC family dehydratase n=1 Tax=Paraburkholderia sp. J67 TaxID=2805435 RepID=UPI002ABD665E|nr:MaoC family dehydratase [Paraburkholderia sp. J67]
MTSTIESNPLEAPRYLDDFKIGDQIETEEFPVTRDMIVTFAQQYDPQPMHLDEAAARSTVFGELVGSGWQTLAVTMRLLVDAQLLGGTPIVGTEFKEMRFHAPMRPGDVLRAHAEVVDICPSKSRPDLGFLDVRVTTKNSADATLITQSWRLVLPRQCSV